MQKPYNAIRFIESHPSSSIQNDFISERVLAWDIVHGLPPEFPLIGTSGAPILFGEHREHPRTDIPINAV